MTWRGVAKTCVIVGTIVAGVVVLRVTDTRENPHRWEGGDGPETECEYEYLADGAASKGGGSVWVERWTVCDPGDEGG